MISIVDDDQSFRDATRRLVNSLGYAADTFASAEAFLQSDCVSDTFCLILDVNMPGLSGIELQTHLVAQGNCTPIIFITAVSEGTIKVKALNLTESHSRAWFLLMAVAIFARYGSGIGWRHACAGGAR
jgi:FixJ family two-component response regulator